LGVLTPPGRPDGRLSASRRICRSVGPRVGTSAGPYRAGAPTFTEEGEITLASYDGQVYRWDTSLAHTLAFACQMAGRNLISSEWDVRCRNLTYEKTCPSG
jgi:hypothetical protein